MAMSSSRPYLTRALYEWIVDNDCTPYILANAMVEGVLVPEQYIKDDQIVLNISPSAVVGLELNDDEIHFNGRFGGVAVDIYVPMSAVMGIYARENGQGMVFDLEDPATPPKDPSPKGVGNGEEGNKPGLRVVK